MPSPNDPATLIISGLLTGGGAKYIYDFYKDWRARPTKEQRQVASVDASIITVSRARDELEEDNSRLRATLAEERANTAAERVRFEQDRSAWAAERVSLRADIERLEAQIRLEREESAARYDALLERLSKMARRAAGMETGQIPPVKE